MRHEIERDILRYIDFLRDAGYIVTISSTNMSILKESAISMWNYDNHSCDVCLYLKSNRDTADKCMKNKDILVKADNRVLFNCCWAGVEEYVFPLIHSGQLVCRIHVSGYRGTLARSIRRSGVVAKQHGKEFIESYALLKEDVPKQDDLDRLVKPLSYMFEQLVRESITESADADPIMNLYLRTLWFIYDHFQENIQTETIAQAVNYSPSHLRTVFQKIHGTSIMEYVNLVRMDHATRLLRFTRLPITKIAYECGFRDGNYFSVAFKKHHHSTPSSYRKQYATIGDPPHI